MKESNSQKAVPGYDAATGTSNPGYSRHADKFAKNQHTGHSNDGRTVNFGRGPTGGGTKVPVAKEITMGCHQPQVRTPGGTRAFDPSATKNYKGNADSINVGRGPTKGNQQ
jgi:hypothetical protein